MRNFALLNAATALTTMPLAFDNTAAKPAPKRVEPQLTSVFAGLEMPKRASKRGSASIFPFDSLTEIGQCFGVKNRDAKSMSSIISNANKKARTPKRDDAGNIVYKTNEMKDANGTVIGRTPTTEPETVATKHFFAIDVDTATKAKIKGTPLEGSTVLVFRDEPKND